MTTIYLIRHGQASFGKSNYDELSENGEAQATLLGQYFKQIFSVHDKFHRTLILSGFCFLKIAKISLNSSFFPKPIKR